MRSKKRLAVADIVIRTLQHRPRLSNRCVVQTLTVKGPSLSSALRATKRRGPADLQYYSERFIPSDSDFEGEAVLPFSLAADSELLRGHKEFSAGLETATILSIFCRIFSSRSPRPRRKFA